MWILIELLEEKKNFLRSCCSAGVLAKFLYPKNDPTKSALLAYVCGVCFQQKS